MYLDYPEIPTAALLAGSGQARGYAYIVMSSQLYTSYPSPPPPAGRIAGIGNFNTLEAATGECSLRHILSGGHSAGQKLTVWILHRKFMETALRERQLRGQ